LILRFLGKAALVAGLCITGASAQEFPTKPIRIVVPYSPGGGTDVVARLVAQKLSTKLGQSVIVENKPGASTNIGTRDVATSPADGYTILITAPNIATSESLFKNPGFRLEDLTPVIQLARYPNVLVAGPGTTLTTLEAVLAQAKAEPQKLSFGTAGAGSNSHLTMELLKQRTGVQMDHVPYKGSGPLKIDLLGGHVPLGIDGLGGLSELITTGKVKPLAVLAPERSPLAPNIPSLGDVGIKDIDGTGYNGALVPAGTPPEVVARLNAAMAEALQDADVRERLAPLGLEVVGGTSEEFSALLYRERAKWAAVIKEAGITSE